ncbi:MAG: serine/threonine-protein kinase [Myxococcota bacterium]
MPSSQSGSAPPGLDVTGAETIAEGARASSVAPARSRQDPFVGETLDGKYAVLAPIARGGMGRVYRARQLPLDREVALKVLDAHRFGEDEPPPDFQKRFFMEAAACAKLTHPNTVVVHDYGKTADGVFYIAMEYLEGSTLRHVIDSEAPLAPERVLAIAFQVCASLSEAHNRGMVHRDLKPSNIMLVRRSDRDEVVKVLDFGLVKDDALDDGTLTQSGALLGTPRYIAPEQIASSRVGPTSDVYSLGAVLYHALAGRPPFDSESKFVLLAAHINVDPTPIPELHPHGTASPEFLAVVMRCLAKDPEKRPASMAELASLLAACPEAELVPSVAASHSGLTGATALPAPRKGPLPRTSGPERAATTRRRWLPAALALAAVGAAALAFLAGTYREPAPAPEPSAPAPVSPVVSPAPGPSAPEATRVRVVTAPPGARLRHGTDELGDAPTELLVPAGESWTLDVSLAGFETRRVVINGSQDDVRVALTPTRRRRRGGRTRPAAAMAPAPSEPETPAMAAPEAAPMRPTEPERPRTDNRNPWAR